MSEYKYWLMAGAILLATGGYVASQTFPGVINGGTVVGNPGTTGDIPKGTSSPVLGAAGSSTGQLGFSGTTSGTVTMQPQAAAGNYNFNLPITPGTPGQPLISGGGGVAPQTYGTLPVAGGGTNCAAASGTCLDNITGFAGTGFLNRSGAGTYTFGTSANVGSVCGAQGLIVANNVGTPNTSIDVVYDQIVMINATGTPIYRPGDALTFTIDTTTGNVTSAANGMDGEVPPVDDWMYIWAIDNGLAVAGLATLSATVPNLPAGYTYKCRLGAMRTAASILKRSLQLGNRAQYRVVTGSNTAAYPIAHTGVYGAGFNTPPYTLLSIADYVPPTATSVQLELANAAAGAAGNAVSPNLSTGAANSAVNPPPCLNNASMGVQCDLVLETPQTVYYAAGGGGNTLPVIGWRDKVSAN